MKRTLNKLHEILLAEKKCLNHRFKEDEKFCTKLLLIALNRNFKTQKVHSKKKYNVK